ncbi:MAG: pteridine reductase [Burkholderiales bacterium]
MQNKVTLVTGGAKRVGAAIVKRLHREGMNVMIHYLHSHAEAHTLRDELNLIRKNSANAMQGDLPQIQDLPKLVEHTLKTFGRLDALVNNASAFQATPVGSISETNWNDLIGANLKAPLFLSQAAAPALKQNNGCIVNIIDIHSERPLKNYVVYSIAKSALIGLTRSLSIELGPEVRVNGVSPGVAAWPADGGHFDAKEQARIINQTSLKRAGTTDDIAGAVKFLVCDATYMTGEIINVDGGRSINM